MKPDDSEQCMTLVGAGYAMARRSFEWRDAMLQDFYRDLLEQANVHPDGAFQSIRLFCQERGRAPDTAELRGLLSGLVVRTNDADAYRRPDRGPTPPGHALALMREGFERRWEEDHPGEPIPPEWAKMLERLSNLRCDQAANWRANQSAQGFATRPNIVLDDPRRSGQEDSRPATPARFAEAATVGADAKPTGNGVGEFFAGLDDEREDTAI